MRNPFTSGQMPLDGPAYDLVPVTPSDTDDFGFVGTGLYIQAGGQVTFRAASGQVRTIYAAENNLFIPVGVTQVLETGTEPQSARSFTWIWVLQPYAP